MAAEWQRPLNWSPNGKVFFPLRLRIRRSVEPPPVPRSYRPAARTFSESATSLEPPPTQSRRGDREPDPDRAQRHHTLSGRATVPSPYLDSARKELRDRCGPGHLGAKLEPRGRRAPVVVRQQRIGSSLRAGFGSALFLRGGFGDAESDDQLRLQSYLVVILRAASGELVLSAGTFGLRRRGPP